MKIVNTRKFITSISIITIFCIISISFVFGIVSKDDGEIIKFHQHIVVKGETVWDIARIYKHDDIRELVYEISVENNLSDYVIFPGQTLDIPVN